MMPPRPKTSPIQTHIRRRHPQETLGGERLDVPSPIDEDEVPTPPSAAEAAGSQLELLTVSDVEMQGVERSDGVEHLPQIAVSHSQDALSQMPSSSFANSPGSMMVRKQRQRSGALSAAGYGSPMRGASLDGSNMVTMGNDDSNVGGNKRGISMGYRPDCEKCRLKVPGHMNHFFWKRQRGKGAILLSDDEMSFTFFTFGIFGFLGHAKRAYNTGFSYWL
jgi:hypothetical protein